MSAALDRTTDAVKLLMRQTLLPVGAGLLAALIAMERIVESRYDSPEAQAALGAAWHALMWPLTVGIVSFAVLLRARLHSLLARDTVAGIVKAIARGAEPAAAALDAIEDESLREAIEKMRRNQEIAVLRIDRQRRSLEGMGVSVTTMNENLNDELESVRDVSRAVEENLTFHHSLQQNIDSLSHSAEQSSSSVLEMVAINNEVRENIHNLALSVQETASAIEEMALSSKEVAKNIEELSTAAEETAASMNEMDVSISQVETNANETSKLSETVSGDAETGVTAIKQTIRGIDRIKESSRVGAEVIGNLGQRISEIGNILNVIDDVAEQTNLLALNAAIIAAQAGEHGRGFAVVADEIKALAERTGASTKEIADLVKTIQDQSRNAIDVMSKGVEDVEEGVRLGHNAEDALRKIVDSAKRSTLMIQAIAQATVEQAKGSKQVTNAISRIAETVQQIAFATAEQAKGSEHIMQSAERMRTITQQVERSADEQNRGGRQITQAIENIRDMVEQIGRAQRQQSEGGERMSVAATRIQACGERSLAACEQIQAALGHSEDDPSFD